MVGHFVRLVCEYVLYRISQMIWRFYNDCKHIKPIASINFMGCLLALCKRSTKQQEEHYEQLKPDLSLDKEFDLFMKENDTGGTSLIDPVDDVITDDSDDGPVMSRKQPMAPIEDEPYLL